MENLELLQAISIMLQEQLKPINDRLDRLEQRQEEIRSGVNRLSNWAEECGYVVKFPLPQI